MKISTTLCALALVASGALSIALPAPAAIPAYIAAAVADAARPEADRKRDADRKPAETLLFANIHPGEQVVELVPGGGYYTRLLSHVVGKHGRIFAVSPAPRTAPEPGEPDRSAAVKAIAADPHYANVTVLIQPIASLSLPEKADVVWTSQNYHDVHNVTGLDLQAFNKSIFDALKPGGEYFVIDHSAAADAPADVTSTLHRIDSELVKREVIAAGFVLEEESPLLRNSADPRTAAVFDPAIRGKTDQFVLKFRKPKH
jgi:predicted methyltransferase